MPIALLSKMPGAGSQAVASDPATRSVEHQLLPRRLHPAPRTEPTRTDFTQTTARAALRCQFPDLARSRRRSQTPGRRDRLLIHPAHLGIQPAAPLPYTRSPSDLLLFDASSRTLLEVAADPKRLGAEIGFLSILHTWGSNLLPHYHIHAVVPGGGLSADHQRWIHTTHPMFLLPVPVLRTVFRKKFLAGLHHLYRKGLLNLRGPAAPLRDPALFDQLIEKLGNKNWYVHAEPPFGGPEHRSE